MDTRTKKLLITLLAVSFSLNLLFVGFMVGKSMHKPKGHGKGFKSHHMPRLGWIMKELPEEKREILRPLMEKQREDRHEKYQQLRELRKDAHDLLVAENFDKEAFSESLNKLSEATMSEQEQLQEHLATIAEHLSQEERVHLAKVLKKFGGHKKRRDKRRRHRD